MKQFYLAYPNGSLLQTNPDDEAAEHSEEKGSTLLGQLTHANATNSRALFPPLLSWSHYLVLLRVAEPQARAFYEIEAAQEAWSVRELERQYGSLLYERLSMSRDKARVRALANEGLTISRPADIVKDPFVLEFLGLEEHADWLEQDLETAILNHLESFLLELGKGFCFVARQRRLTLDGDHYRVDLVFYN